MPNPRWFLWIPFTLVPLVAWSRDIAVAVLALGAIAMLLNRNVQWREKIIAGFRTPWVLSGTAFVMWTFLTLLWSPHAPFTTWLKTTAAIGLALILASGLAFIPAATIKKLMKPALWSVFALFALLIFERATDGFLIRFDRAWDTSVEILNTLSGGLVLLSCICFPAAWLLRLKTGNWLWPSVLLAAVLALSLSYRMDAIPAGLITGMLAFIFVLRWGSRGFAAILGIIGVAALLWAPLSVLASELEVDAWLIDNVDRNWGFRVIIWSHVGNLILDHLVIGYGFDASRVLGASADLLPDKSGNSTFLHPHNGILQIWLELGFIGVAMFAATAVLLFRRVLACAFEPGALAGASGALTFSTTIWMLSYGVWQGWWLSVLGLTAGAAILALRTGSPE